MNKSYNNEIITAYLLGTLPEAEAENFDELSFTDDDFADELNAAEKDLVDAYVRGELRGTTLEQFKSYYLASPVRREKVKFARTFQEFGEEKVKEKPIAAAETEQRKTLSGFFSDFFTFQRPLLQWGFAALALTLLIFGGFMYRENSRLLFEVSQSQTNRNELLERESELRQREIQLQNEIASQTTINSETELELAKIREEREQLQLELKQSQQQQKIIEQKRLNEQRAATKNQTTPAPSRQISIATFTLAPSLRGNNDLQTISIPAKTDSARMRLELESDEFPDYRAVLRNLSDNKIIWQSGKIKPKSDSTNKILNVVFPAKLLKSSIYSLEVSGVAADKTAETIGSYSFRVGQ